MALQTEKHLRNQVLYCAFVRNHTPQGTLEALRQDLGRIQSLGVDILWLMPIHPLGETARKGTLGSPYAIRDYRAIDPALGTLEDFEALVEDLHSRGMKCIMDVVYNHTAPDSVLAQEHPEWFWHKPDGSFGNRIGDWTDIIDLDYSHRELWDYQIRTLKQWASLVDGFRCDVAPLIPLEFWLEARSQVEKVRPGCIWLAESVEPEFLLDNRARGMTALSDGEIFQAFDVAYDYDTYGLMRGYLRQEISLETYGEALRRQEYIYPDNYIKLRFLENHDQDRMAEVLDSPELLDTWTAFLYFQKGLTLLYAGQEIPATHRPSLFDRDPVDWSPNPHREDLLRRLYWLKKDPLFALGRHTIRALPQDVLELSYEKDGDRLLGLFSLGGETAFVDTDLPDGTYPDLLSGRERHISGGRLLVENTVILRLEREDPEEPEEPEESGDMEVSTP